MVDILVGLEGKVIFSLKEETSKEGVDSEQGETLYSRRRTRLCFHPREVGRRSNIKDKMYMQM